MKKKKIFMFLIILFLILIIITVGYIIYKNTKNNNKIQEYIPEQELDDEHLRQTLITLYFLNIDSGELMPEVRKIDVKDLLQNPYMEIMKLLIEGPKNEKLVKLLPDNTKINKAEIKNGIVNLDLSQDFINSQELGKEQEEKIINSIVKSLMELNEVNGIYITIDGEENKAFPDNEVNFSDIFYNI